MAMRFQYGIFVSSSHPVHNNSYSLSLSSSDHAGLMSGARPGVSFLVGTSLVVMSILSVSAAFSCCYHCVRMRSSSSSSSSPSDSPSPASSSSSSSLSSSSSSTMLLRLQALTGAGGRAAATAASNMQSTPGAADNMIPSSASAHADRYNMDLQLLHLQLRPLPPPHHHHHPRITRCSPIVDQLADQVPCPPVVYMPGDQKPTFIAWPCPHPSPPTIIMHPTTHPCVKIG